MKTIPAFLAATFLAAPALAGSPAPVPAEPVVQAPAPMVAPARNWTGPYFGGSLGYGNLSRDVSGSGAIGGLHLGFNQDFGGFVLGAELDYDRASINFSGGGGSLDEVLRLKLRGGVPMGDVLVYGTVGPARAKADIGGVSHRETGIVGGIGAEFAVAPNWSVGGELLHHRFRDFGGTGTNVDATTLQARVNFRF